METNIQYINIYNDGLIDIIFICNSCKIQNVHTITHTLTKTNDKITIDFLKIGNKCCDNCGNFGISNNRCCADYSLYK